MNFKGLVEGAANGFTVGVVAEGTVCAYSGQKLPWEWKFYWRLKESHGRGTFHGENRERRRARRCCARGSVSVFAVDWFDVFVVRFDGRTSQLRTGCAKRWR